jgi:hypothetical protein
MTNPSIEAGCGEGNGREWVAGFEEFSPEKDRSTRESERKRRKGKRDKSTRNAKVSTEYPRTSEWNAFFVSWFLATHFLFN